MNKRGSILFETFAALMVLSVAIAAMLSVMSANLFANARNIEKKEAIKIMDKLMFEWFAYPDGLVLSDRGKIELPGGRKGDLGYAVASKRFGIPTDQKLLQDVKMNQFYEVVVQIKEEDRPARVDFKALLFQSKKTA